MDHCTFAFYLLNNNTWKRFNNENALSAVLHTLVILFSNNVILAQLSTEKFSRALPDADDFARLLPDFEKLGESFGFLKGLFSAGERLSFSDRYLE
mgnify:CR=1 FL=1